MGPPSHAGVHIRLAEPVVFLRNLDSATDRRERRAQRRRAQEAAAALQRSREPSTSASASASAANSQQQPQQPQAPASLFGGSDQTYVPPHGRGGAGSRSRDRSNSNNAQARSASRGRPLISGAAAGSPSRSRSASRGGPSSSASASAAATAAAATDGGAQRGRSSAPRYQASNAANNNNNVESSSRSRTPSAAPIFAPPPLASSIYRSTSGGNTLHTPGGGSIVRDDNNNADAEGSAGGGGGGPNGSASGEAIQPDTSGLEITRPPAIVRGVMTVHFTKPTRVKKIGVRLRGTSKTEWPEGLGPRRLDTVERTTLMDETVIFFDATSSSASHNRRAASLGPNALSASTSQRDSSQPPQPSFSRSASLAPPMRTGQSFDGGAAPGETSASALASASGLGLRAPSLDAQRTLIPQNTATATQDRPDQRGPAPAYSPQPLPSQQLYPALQEHAEQQHQQALTQTLPVAEAESPVPGPSSSPSLHPIVPPRPPSTGRPASPSPLSPRRSPHPSQQNLATVASGGSSSHHHHQPHHHHQQHHAHHHGHLHHIFHRHGTPHEHFQDRAAELRAEAGAISPPSTPPLEPSPAPSRASSLYDRPIASTAPVHGDSAESSRPASLESLEEADSLENGAPEEEEENGADHLPDIATPLEPTESNASGITLSTSSGEDNASLHEERGRSAQPVGRGAQREAIANQTILEDGPGESYADDSREVYFPENGNVPLASPPIDLALVSDVRPPPSSSHSRSPMPSTSALRNSSAASTERRSSSVASTGGHKSARFSLSSLIRRDKSSSRQGRTASPDVKDSNKRATSSSRGKSTGLKALKNALTGSHDEKDNLRLSTNSAHTPASSDADTDSEDEGGRGRNRSSSRSRSRWQEFKAGTYNFPIYIPIPLSMPPTIHANHGQVTYMLKGFVNRAGALTTNMHSVTEVHVVAAPHEDDLEAIESIIVERMWETQLNYRIVLHCKSVPIGGEIPITIRLNPLSKMKLFRVTATLEEKFTIYAKERKLARNESVRRYDLVKIQKEDNSPMLPIISEDPDALQQSPLRDWIVDSASTDGTGIQTLDPFGPWILESSIPVPDCSSTLQFSTSHEKANISVIHSLKVVLRVERGDDEYVDGKGQRKKFDIIVEAPMHILSCRTATANSLPTYSTNANQTTNPFHAHNVISIDSSAFHPHELSDAERHIVHYRASNATMAVVNAARSTSAGRNNQHPPHSMTAAATGVSDDQLQQALLSGGGAVAETAGPPPPTYEYARAHPDESAPSSRRTSTSVM